MMVDCYYDEIKEDLILTVTRHVTPGCLRFDLYLHLPDAASHGLLSECGMARVWCLLNLIKFLMVVFLQNEIYILFTRDSSTSCLSHLITNILWMIRLLSVISLAKRQVSDLALMRPITNQAQLMSCAHGINCVYRNNRSLYY